LLVIADLLGVPEEDRGEFAAVLRRRSEAGVGSTGDDTLQHGPLEYLYERFSRYIDDRRREPREDVLTGLAAATFRTGLRRRSSTSCAGPPTSSQPARRQRCAC
jgi:cytochrome P450